MIPEPSAVPFRSPREILSHVFHRLFQPVLLLARRHPALRGPVFTRRRGPHRLVAPNGAGKSTLLKLIAGEYTPSAGSVTVDGVLGYLPQTLPFAGDRTVAEVLGVAPVIDALTAIEPPATPSEENFAAIGNDWDIEERTRAQLDRLGLGDLTLDRQLGTLSGGQVVSLGLAAQLLKRPDVLLLDEPTNNLDRRRPPQALRRPRATGNGCLLLVSHDRALLDRMDRIAELRPRRDAVLSAGTSATTRKP